MPGQTIAARGADLAMMIDRHLGCGVCIMLWDNDARIRRIRGRKVRFEGAGTLVHHG